jgi:Transposase protein
MSTAMPAPSVPLPFPPAESRTQWLSARCCLQHDGELRVVVVGGAPLLHFAAGDRVHERLAAALIAESGAARVGAVLTAFGLDDATLWRARQRLQAGGVAALLPAKRGPQGPRTVRPAVARRIVALRHQGVSEQRIADRLGLSRFSVRRVLKREGLGGEARPAEPLPLEAAGAPPAPAPAGDPGGAAPVEATETTPAPGGPEMPVAEARPGPAAEPAAGAPRVGTPELAWLNAILGLTRDGEAEVVFESRRAVPGAGVLLAIPALAATGLLEAARATYGRLRPAVYGLRATILVLWACALMRRPRPEALKGTDPAALGDVLGLLRAPEVKTVRRKLREIAQLGKVHTLLRALATRWLALRDDVLGVLYVDGHVRVYHGQRTLPKAHVAQRNLCVPATTDYWVNDAEGAPVFVVTAPANAALTRVLPDLLAELEALGGGRRGTAVFDRGGWSPKLFTQLIDRGWHLLTYRKGRRRKHPRRGFAEQRLQIEGREVRYTLSERPIRLRNGLRLREIAELRDDGEQTIFVTSHVEHPGVLLAYRMFERWRQENYFRYMKENFALDALVDYGVEADDPQREVPNPARKRLEATLREARAELAELERTYGAAAAANAEAQRRTMRGFKIAHGQVGRALRVARARVATLTAQRATMPKRVPIGQVLGPEQVVRLTLERKLFTDAIKAAAYRAESVLLRRLRPHFTRADDEGRAFLRAALHQPADLVVEAEQLRVRVAPMSAPRFTAALRALCDELNALEPHFPETPYRLRYEVADPPEAG